MNKSTLTDKISILIATMFGIGYLTKMPGTIGSLFAAAIYCLIPVNCMERTSDLLQIIILLILAFLFTIAAQIAERKLGKDNSKIICDEVIGYFVSVLFFPKSIIIAITALILFRILDIFKPFPINKMENIKGGLGIMSDDIVAGIFANLILRLAFLIKPEFFKII